MAISARPAGSASATRPAAAPRAAPTTKPIIAGQVCDARRRPATRALGSLPSSTSPASIVKRVMLVVITAVLEHRQRLLLGTTHDHHAPHAGLDDDRRGDRRPLPRPALARDDGERPRASP